MKNITNVFYEFLIALCCLMSSSALWAWEDMSMPRLHVEGRYLVDPHGNKVNLHGFAQTYSPWFNEMGQKWDNYDVEKCLKYNQGLIDDIMAAGWKMNFLRLHMDPYWSNSPGIHVEGENDISAFDFNRFKNYLDRVFIPMAEYAVSKGLYVVMRPPGVCPEKIAVGDEYNQYLIKVWTHVAQHPKLKNHPNIMFELANEPINILGPDGTYGAGSQGHFDKLKEYFQSVVDAMRAQGCGNILWIPGLGYQGLYKGFAVNPIEGDNIGYAVHLYPGWMGSDGENGDGGSSTGGYEPFQKGWDDSVAPVASFAPIMITEMDWAPSKYNASWGKAHTGTFGGPGFGANMKHIVDNSGNVSWLIFTGADLLAKFKDTPPAEGEAYTFLTDPEACPWAMYHWFKEYAEGVTVNGEPERLELMGEQATRSLQMGGVHYLKVKAVYKDGTSRMVTAEATINSSDEQVLKVEPTGKLVAVAPGNATVTVTYRTAAGNSMQQTLQVTVVSPFVLTEDVFDPSIWEEGTFDETTRTLVTGKYGFGGWKYPGGLDLSGYRRLTVELGNDNECGVSFRLFDKNDYWTKPATYDFGQTRRVVVDLQQMKDTDGNRVDPSHLYIVGFWSTGGKPIVISSMKLE